MRRSEGFVSAVIRVCFWAGVGLLFSGCSTAPSILDPRGPEARQIANLTWALFGTAVVVFLIVSVILVFAIARRRDKVVVTVGPDRQRTLVAVIAAGGVVPAVALTVLMGAGIVIEQALVVPPSTPHYTIEVVGHEWWWEINYPDQGFTTANEMHIPVGQPVSVKLTSADVIHSFWVPQLHSKLDMFPGQTNTLWLQADQSGMYLGECGEYCGLQHAKMNFVVVADTPENYAQWLANQQQVPPAPTDSLLKQGQQTFLGSTCVYCHVVRGTNASGKLGPDLTHLASRSKLGAGILDNNRANLAGWIVNAQSLKPGNHMPPMYLTPDELQAILAYLESLK